jgi:hypothetical protein
LSSSDDFGLAEPITRALADERYVVSTSIQKHPRPIAINDHDVARVSQLDTVTATVVALPILHQLTIHEAHEPIDRVLVFQARHRADKRAPSPLKLDISAEANYSNTSQSQRVLATRLGQVCICVASVIAVRATEVGGVNHDVNCDRLDAPESYVPWKGRTTTRSSLRRRNFMLQSRRNVVAAGDQEADWDITFATNQRTARPPQHSHAKGPVIRTIRTGRRPINAASARRATGAEPGSPSDCRRIPRTRQPAITLTARILTARCPGR